MSEASYSVLVLAAGRGANDPMASAFGVTHKCLLDISGTPMIMRVLNALRDARSVARIAISIEDPDILSKARGYDAFASETSTTVTQSADRASASVARALETGAVDYPLLVTTADHALLTASIVDTFCERSLASGGDLTVGLASARTILGAYPDNARTFLKFSDGGYSGCNLFAFNHPRAKSAIEFWQHVERNRKTPWKLIGAFGIVPLLLYATRLLSLERAFSGGSKRLGLQAAPIELHDPHAAIDVDKPSDLELVERILAGQ